MKRPDLYQLITVILIFGIVVTLGVFVFNLSKGKLGKAALNVDVVYDSASVLVNGKDKGETPVYTEEIFAGEADVEINGKNNSYSTTIRPAAGTLAVVKRDLGVSGAFSSGQNIWFTKSGGEEAIISVISPDTDEVSVIVDGVEMGKTPIRFSTKELLTQSEEDRYVLTFKKDSYEEQEVEVRVRPGYELTVRVDMFLKPIPTDINTLSGLPEGVQFINFSNVANVAFADKQAWAKAVNYWLNTRGAATFGNNKVEKFNYFIADNGKVYNENGNEIGPSDMSLELNMFVAYLGSQQVSELTEAAKKTIAEALGEGVVATLGNGAFVKIKPTGLGFLRVRSGAGTGNQQVARVNVGETFPYTEEKNGWYKIEYEEGKEGWISGTYAEVVSTASQE